MTYYKMRSLDPEVQAARAEALNFKKQQSTQGEDQEVATPKEALYDGDNMRREEMIDYNREVIEQARECIERAQSGLPLNASSDDEVLENLVKPHQSQFGPSSNFISIDN